MYHMIHQPHLHCVYRELQLSFISLLSLSLAYVGNILVRRYRPLTSLLCAYFIFTFPAVHTLSRFRLPLTLLGPFFFFALTLLCKYPAFHLPLTLLCPYFFFRTPALLLSRFSLTTYPAVSLFFFRTYPAVFFSLFSFRFPLH